MVQTRSMIRKVEEDKDAMRKQTDEDMTRKYLKLHFDEKKIQECPNKCGAVISKVCGCRKVKCSICGCKFCYNCKSINDFTCAGASGHAFYNNMTGDKSD